MFPPILSHPLLVVTEPWFEFPESYSKFPLAIYLLMVVYMLPCYTLHLSHPLLPPSTPPGSMQKEQYIYIMKYYSAIERNWSRQ